MIFVDANILVHAANASSPQHEPARRLLDELRAGQRDWCTSWPVLYETLRVLTHPAVFARPLTTKEAFQYLKALLACPSLHLLSPTELHEGVLEEVVEDAGTVSGCLWHDVQNVALMLEHGARTVASFDPDFRRFRVVKAIEPDQIQ